ncbi:MAG: hydrogenase maturation nickel metallochaperone HypA [Rhodospirillum sp.]|nr:hydrogenase maturation nickel metallochaperone HypA [Rhodospirillum sp.]MCF8489236.1 hydrogenase maturation nickel metallochaperone HypA [Rhodospirillum sp.]MCF8500527.1 hydrogenase maturation nickel metallochaperone HypA [Rhodospirillum sp.]
MHEFSVMEGLMTLLADHAQAHAITRITRVRLVVGQLRGLDVNQLRGCFDLLVEGTSARSATLEIDFVPAEGHCDRCDKTFVLPNFVLTCPVCGDSRAVRTTKGRELYLEKFEGTKE